MDVGGSLLDQACVRVVLLPVGSNLSEERFEQLADYFTSWREIALNVLPRRSLPNRTFNTSASGNATYSHLPHDLRDGSSSTSESSGSRFLSRTFSTRNNTDPSASFPASKSASKDDSAIKRNNNSTTAATTFQTPQQMADHFSGRQRGANIGVKGNPARRSRPSSSRMVSLGGFGTQLSLDIDTVDSLLRLRYEIIRRSPNGEYGFRAPSNWDEFHSRRVWGVIGIADCTAPELANSDPTARDALLQEAQAEFINVLKKFPTPCVSRVVVFTTPDAAREQGASVVNSPTVADRPVPMFPEPGADIIFGYVPETPNTTETRQEARVQVIHFSGLLLHVLDRESWRKEKSSNDLFLTPIDDSSTADKHPKLVKRRAGRLDKLLGDIQLLMGVPQNALAKYTSAIEKAKANSDRLWQAGSMEGWATAHVLTHIKKGGTCEDPAFTNKLIEHYAEIYKLYTKKRVPELEASAALRLAEFLGRYTPRRKEALEAAGHAAEVGEALASVKRATLWQALARFSEDMKCYRKAAFYLYKVGSLCAGKSIWPSAEALLTCSSNQFSRPNTDKSVWADLHRDVLLEAGKAAWELGDAFLATQHYVKALSLSASTLKQNSDADASLVKLLLETTTPPYLPIAAKLLKVHGLGAMRLPYLVVNETTTPGKEQPEATKSPSEKKGPFIYDPFKAKALREAAAVAGRTVTWVSGEISQVVIKIQNQTHTHLPVEVLAVVILSEEKREELLPTLEKVARNASNPDFETGGDEEPQALHAEQMKYLLKEVTKNVETISETVTLPPMKRKKYTEKIVSVRPKNAGTMQLCGVIVRMFKGTIVLLSMPKEEKGELGVPPIKVIKALPQLAVSIRQDDGELSSLYSPSRPTIIFEGEQRRFSVRVKNVGNQDITQLKMQVMADNPQYIQLTNIGKDAANVELNNVKVGAIFDFPIEVFGKTISSSACSTEKEKSSSGRTKVQVGELIAVIKYSGAKQASLERQSRASISLALRPAIRISSLSMFSLPPDVKKKDMRYVNGEKTIVRKTNSTSSNNNDNVFGLSMDVENLVPVPLMIALPAKWQTPNLFTSSNGSNKETTISDDQSLSDACPTVNVLECGASTRLITAIPKNDFTKKNPAQNDAAGKVGEEMLSISWAMPGVGRSGAAKLFRRDIAQAKRLVNDGGKCTNTKEENTQMDIEINLDAHESFRSSGGITSPVAVSQVASNQVMKLNIREYYKGTVVVRNSGTEPFPDTAVVDLCVLQNDGRGCARFAPCAILVGAVECVNVGALAPGERFELAFKLRFTSGGLFELNTFVHLWEDNERCSLDLIMAMMGMNKRDANAFDDGGNEKNYSIRNGKENGKESSTRRLLGRYSCTVDVVSQKLDIGMLASLPDWSK